MVGLVAGLGVVIASAEPARGTEVGYARRYGVGLILGGPTGITGKAWVAPAGAVDVGIGGYGYGFRGGCFRDADGRDVCGHRWRGHGTLSVHADYLWQAKIVESSAVQLDWHVGAGPRLLFHGDPCAFDCWNVGARGPIGLDLTFTRPAFLEIFLELAPAVYVTPTLFFAFDSALGARAYF